MREVHDSEEGVYRARQHIKEPDFMTNDFSCNELTPEEFDPLVLGDDGLVVVYFRSNAAPLCQTLDPLMKRACQKLSPEVNFWLVNVDQNPSPAIRFSIETTPTLLIFKNGNIETKIVGLLSEEDLVQKIEQCLLDRDCHGPLSVLGAGPESRPASWTSANSLSAQ